MQNRYVWVAVRVSDGINQGAEYRGRMDADVFEQITSNEMTSGWFRLDSILWERDRVDVPQSEAGQAWGYGDTSFFRVEWLARIVVLSEAFVQSVTRTASRH